MLTGVGKSLAHFFVAFVNGSYIPSDPYEWGHLNISPDRGADMVCTDNFLGYEAGICCGTDYDPSHDANTVGKNTLKKVGLWSIRCKILFSI